MKLSRPLRVGDGRACARVLVSLMGVVGASAHAQAMGQGLINYVTPIILFLGIGAVVVALIGALFRPDIVRGAVFAAIILVVVFFLLKNVNGFTAAIQG